MVIREPGTVRDAGKLALQAFQDMKPVLPDEEETGIQEVLCLLQTRDMSANKKLHLFERITPILRSERTFSSETGSPTQNAQAVEILSLLLRYAISPGFLLRTWYKGDAKDDPYQGESEGSCNLPQSTLPFRYSMIAR